MKQPVGYLCNARDGLHGDRGIAYSYILAGNGVFVHGETPGLKATVLVARAQIRGLAPLANSVELPGGKIPRSLYMLALAALAADSRREKYIAVTWDGDYHLAVPPQEGSGGGVTYTRLPNALVDIHSHAGMNAFFSWTDDRDEQGLGIYVVVGHLDMVIPDVKLRVGVYGYFAPIEMQEVFDV